MLENAWRVILAYTRIRARSVSLVSSRARRHIIMYWRMELYILFEYPLFLYVRALFCRRCGLRTRATIDLFNKSRDSSIYIAFHAPEYQQFHTYIEAMQLPLLKFIDEPNGPRKTPRRKPLRVLSAATNITLYTYATCSACRHDASMRVCVFFPLSRPDTIWKSKF